MGAESSAPSLPEDRLPPFFPRRPRECQWAADPFFKCFSEHHSVASIADATAGGEEVGALSRAQEKASTEALVKCLNEKKAYERCMLRLEKTKGERKLYRVQEEYRVAK